MYAKLILYLLKIGNSIVAITIDVIPLKIPRTTELMIWFEFSEVVIRKLSKKSTEPCKNWKIIIPEIKTNNNNTPINLPVF